MIYDYKCNKCGELFEVWTTLAEKEKGLHPKCPKCGSEETRQVINAFSVGGSSKTGGGMNMPPCGPTVGPGCC